MRSTFETRRCVTLLRLTFLSSATTDADPLGWMTMVLYTVSAALTDGGGRSLHHPDNASGSNRIHRGGARVASWLRVDDQH